MNKEAIQKITSSVEINRQKLDVLSEQVMELEDILNIIQHRGNCLEYRNEIETKLKEISHSLKDVYTFFNDLREDQDLKEPYGAHLFDAEIRAYALAHESDVNKLPEKH